MLRGNKVWLLSVPDNSEPQLNHLLTLKFLLECFNSMFPFIIIYLILLFIFLLGFTIIQKRMKHKTYGVNHLRLESEILFKQFIIRKNNFKQKLNSFRRNIN